MHAVEDDDARGNQPPPRRHLIPPALEEINRQIVACQRCERLTRFRRELPPRASFRGQEYWAKPLPGFGDPDGWLLVFGLAPAAHGGNRTGRVFTGDESAKFLMRALHSAGFANQSTSTSRHDGLAMRGCYITAAVKCVPPDNKPTADEFRNCSSHVRRELTELGSVTAVVALGQMAFKAYLDIQGVKGLRFKHGGVYRLGGAPAVYASYHPSPRNTFTGKLTQRMLVSVFERAKRDRSLAVRLKKKKSASSG